MSEIRDRRRRTDLVVFVLALIETGVSTPYEMQKMAGLSQGATIPVLQKLLEADLVRQLKTGPSGDLDADLRVALLAVGVGGDRQLAVGFLRQSADRKLETVQSVCSAASLNARPACFPPSHDCG